MLVNWKSKREASPPSVLKADLSHFIKFLLFRLRMQMG